MLGGRQRLRERVLQARKFSDGIVAASEKEHESQELRGVHPAQTYFSFAKKQQHSHEYITDQLDNRRRHSGDTGRSQIGAPDALGNFRKATPFAILSPVGFYDVLIG